MRYTLTVVETETGAWAVLEPTGRQVWASPSHALALRTAAEAMGRQARLAELAPAETRSDRARRAAWAQIDGRR